MLPFLLHPASLHSVHQQHTRGGSHVGDSHLCHLTSNGEAGILKCSEITLKLIFSTVVSDMN